MPTINPPKQLQKLTESGCQFAFYFFSAGQSPILLANCERFESMSIIKVPILLAWLQLERAGEVSRTEICSLDDEEQVQGAGFSWLLQGRKLPFHDVLLLMIALSDNLCTNLVIRRIGLERLDRMIRQDLNLPGIHLERRLMDHHARAQGRNNWITAQDCIHLFDRFDALPSEDRAWAESLLAVNQDDALFKRSIPRDTLTFFHKTGSDTGVLHDWGYTRSKRIFLLTRNVTDEPAVFDVFGALGRLLVEN